ncbi:PAS domain-containing hybrid sensor histidine kinase/response regulator [Rubrivivax rivuli]|nr:PAS domain-containing sensor histidine kinase [Rubrivivax rivuli]
MALDPSATEGTVSRDLLYRSLFEHSPMEVHIWQLVRDEQGALLTWRLVEANAAALKAWGLRLEDAVGRTAGDLFPDADTVATLRPMVEEIMASGQPLQWERAFAGAQQIFRMMSIPVGDCFISTGFDVTAERQRQQALEHALQSVTQATLAGGVGLWDWDLRTNEVHYSDAWKRQLGYAPDEVADSFEEWRVRVHPDDLEPTLAAAQASLEDPGQPYDVIVRMRHRDGSYRWILGQASVLRDEAGRPRRMVGSQIDITERRRLEDRVREAQKLESLGTLAAGIAHDFNNLLTAVRGNVSLLRAMPLAPPEADGLLKVLEDATGRAAALTKQLLTFAKGGAPVREVASIGELIVDSATFVARGSKARCEFAIASDLAAVHADVGQLSQVIGNLVINAIQAMPQGGAIRIGAGNTRLGAEHASGLPAGPYVQITVADEGGGISPADLPHIFDPFFTTKPQGSGLGLSTSYAILARHGGRITVESTLGQGSLFTLFLPATDAVPRAPAVPCAVAGTGRILVMDDDETIRVLAQRMLERLGYAADACGHGEEALALYGRARQAGQPYDAVILDLTIPGHEGGAQVLARLRAHDPQVVAIVASGYADDDVLAHHEAHGFRGRLQKPFDLTTLSVELARVLGLAPSGGARSTA